MKLKVYTKDGSNFTEQEFENIPQFEGDKGVFALKETIVAYRANARQGNASAVKAELEKASKNEKLAQRAAKDVEFAQYR